MDLADIKEAVEIIQCMANMTTTCCSGLQSEVNKLLGRTIVQLNKYIDEVSE